jgi:plasmid stabilization system protein ParE
MFTLVVTTGAEDDISHAAVWYEHQRKGLGAEFLLALEAELTSILRNPLQYSEHRFGFRRGILRRFPYAIVFRIDNEQLIIVAVWHFSRKPWAWRKRK